MLVNNLTVKSQLYFTLDYTQLLNSWNDINAKRNVLFLQSGIYTNGTFIRVARVRENV